MSSIRASLGQKFVLAAVALATLTALVGCPGGSTTTESGSEILVGHFASMSGSEATFGKSTDNGIRLALEEANAAGGIHGKKIVVKTYDDQGDSNKAGSAVQRLISSDKVVAVLGEVASDKSLAGAPVCQEFGIPMVTPSSTNPRVTQVGDKIFRVCFIDPFQGYVCAKFARGTGMIQADRAAILYDQASSYSTGLAEEFKKAFESMGGKIVTQQAYTGGDQDFDPQLRTIRGAEAQVIFIPGYYTEVANIAIQARKLGMKMPLLGGDGWDSSQLAKIAKDNIEGCYYSNHYSLQDPNERSKEFIEKYNAKFPEDADGLAALGYDAANLLFDAMRRAPSLSGADLAKALSETKDFKGVTGTISIDADRNAVKPAVILKMVKGVPTYVTTIDPPK